MRTRTWHLGVVAAVTLVILCAPEEAAAQLNQYCTVSVLNRTVRVNADGTWVLPNIPAGTGRVKARATCVQNGVTRFGESEFFTVPRNGVVNLPRIVLGAVTPIPASLVLTPSPAVFSGVGQTSQLIATATYPDGSIRNVAAAEHGTDYTSSNPAIVSVSADGLLTANASGTVVIQAINEGTPGMLTVTVVLSTSDTDGDGIPDDIEVSRGMDPRNPVDAIEDFDRDDLTNLDEYRTGTDLRDPDSDDDDLKDGREVRIVLSNPLFADTDGDDIPDGVEVTTSTNPLNRNSYDLRRAVAVSTLLPTSFLLTTNPVFTETFQQLSWIVRLIDNKTVLDLTADPRTSYLSSDLQVCSFGVVPGRVFAGQSGTCTILISNSTLTVSVPGTINRFTPTAVSALTIPGFANSVDVIGDFAYVAAGAGGLQIVDVSNRVQPAIVASRALPGNANDVVVLNQRAYVAAGSAGLQIVDVSDPLAPVVVGAIATGNVAWDVVVEGPRAYVASGTAGLKVIDVSNPAAPVQIGALALTGTTKGVDVDVARNLAVVARGTTGMSVVDLQNPATPMVIGDLAGGDVRDVAISGNHALLADFARSMTAVDLTNPSAPVLTTSTPRDTGGLLQDVTVFGSLAAGADVFFVNGVPLFEVSDAANPVPKVIVNFPPPRFRDDEGTGIALDSAFVYLTAGVASVIENGVSSTRSALYIGQYRSDDQTPPVVTIQSPPPNHSALEGSLLPVTIDAADNFAVASVSVLVDGQLQASTTTSPYEVTIPVPVGQASIVLSAQAVDFAGNRGTSSDVPVIVLPDTERPVVQLTAPVAPLVVPEGTVIQATATASDNVAVTRVEFLLNDVIVATRTSPPYEAFITLPIGPTTFRFSARAFDPAGNAGTAPEVVVNVTSDPPPTVRILSPATGTTISEGSVVTLVIDATDNGAVMSTELTGLVDGKEIFRHPINIGTSQVGTPIGATQVTLIASATDNLGQVGTAQVVLTIEPEPAPTVRFVTPVQGDTLVGGSTIRVVLDASDDVAVGAVMLGGDPTGLVSPPYEFDVYVPADMGTAVNHDMRALAIDNIGKTAFVDLSLPVTPDPLTGLQGLVTDLGGLPIEGATVTATSHGLTAELFRVTSELTALPDPGSTTPDAVRVISAPSMIYPFFDPFGFAPLVPTMRDDAQAVIRLRGTLNVPADGVYDFRLVAFPAGLLTVNGIRIIDLSSFDNDNSVRQASNIATLPAGSVPIEIITAASFGTSEIRVEWGPEGGRMQAIPLEALTPAVSPYRAMTGPDGRFIIENVPSVTGGYVVNATATASDGSALSGASARTAPVAAGVADVGTIELSPILQLVANPVSVAFIPGEPRGVDLGRHAYVASGSEGLTRVVIENIEFPGAHAALPLAGEANDVRVLGIYAYVAGGSAGLHVVRDFYSFPVFDMELVTTLPLGGDALRLDFDDNFSRLLVANGAAGLSVVDITNPESPQLLTETPIPGGARGVDFYDGRYAAVAGPDGLTLVDLLNPLSPEIISTLPIADAHAVAVQGQTALVATATALVGVDLRDPFVLQTIFEQPGVTADVRMAGATLAAAAQLTPTSIRASFINLAGGDPAVVNNIDFDSLELERRPSSTVNGVAADGTFVYVTGTLDPSFGGGFFAIGQYSRPLDPHGSAPFIFSHNISEGAAPLVQPREGEINAHVQTMDDVAIASIKIFVNGQLAVTRNTPSSRLWAGDLTVPIPIEADSVTITIEVTDVGGNVASRTATMAVNPFIPSGAIGVTGFATPLGDMATDGQSVWITQPDAPNGLKVLRWLPDSTFSFGTPAAGAHRPTYAAVDGQQNGWFASDASNTVVVIGPLGGQLRALDIPSPGRMFFDGAHMWVVSGTLTLRKFNPATFTEVGNFFTGGFDPGLMAFDGSHLWIVNHGSNTIAKMRPSDGVVVATIPTSANVTGVAFDGANLWIVNGGDNTISVVRVSDHATVATLPTGTAPAGIAFDGRYMYVTNSGNNNATKFRVSDRVARGTLFTGPQPTMVITGGGYLWIYSATTRSLAIYRLR